MYVRIQGETSEICSRREKTKHTLSSRTTVESSVTCLRRRAERPPRVRLECASRGGETVKSIHCFVLSDAKRV